MNKLTLYKGKAMACLFLTCLLLVLSCRKENLLPNSNILEKGLSIQEAKMYFEKNFQKSLKSKTLLSSGAANGLNGQDILAGKQPMWDASVLKNLSLNTNAVLTPIYKEGLYVHVSGKKMVKFGFLNYMMMYRNSKDSIVTEWVELKPTEKWIESKFSRNYEGRILIKDWDGKLKRVINYKEAKTDNLSNSLNAKKLAINGALMTGNNGVTICDETTVYTVITYGPRALCGCKPEHTFEEWAAGQCICSVDKIPRKGFTTTIDVETTTECYEIDEDGGIIGGGSAPVGGGTHPTTPGGNGNGGTNPGDYTPIHCNPDPNYTVPTTPPPAGQDYAIPCSELAIPDDDIPDPNDPVTPLTSTELLIHYYNSDANVDMHLTSAEITFLSANSSIAQDLKDYLQAETLDKKEFGRWMIRYSVENPNLSIEALVQFNNSVKTNPFLLIQDVPCELLRKWIETAKFVPDLTIISKLSALKNSRLSQVLIGLQIARIQKIADASSPIVNMDYFPVKVNQLPIVNGQRLSADQFLHYLRVNLDLFTNQTKTFKPYNSNGIDDRDQWNSNDPKGSIIALDISGPENASVITSKSSSSGWTFTTIYEPMYGDHPVSGHRDFGYISNADGSYTFFTRGVDRLTKVSGDIMEFIPRFFGPNNGIPFSQADGLWGSLQNGIKAFVTSHGGDATIQPSEIIRPNWSLVKDVMDGKKPLSVLSKNCPD